MHEEPDALNEELEEALSQLNIARQEVDAH